MFFFVCFPRLFYYLYEDCVDNLTQFCLFWFLAECVKPENIYTSPVEEIF